MGLPRQLKPPWWTAFTTVCRVFAWASVLVSSSARAAEITATTPATDTTYHLVGVSGGLQVGVRACYNATREMDYDLVGTHQLLGVRFKFLLGKILEPANQLQRSRVRDFPVLTLVHFFTTSSHPSQTLQKLGKLQLCITSPDPPASGGSGSRAEVLKGCMVAFIGHALKGCMFALSGMLSTVHWLVYYYTCVEKNHSSLQFLRCSARREGMILRKEPAHGSWSSFSFSGRGSLWSHCT